MSPLLAVAVLLCHHCCDRFSCLVFLDLFISQLFPSFGWSWRMSLMYNAGLIHNDIICTFESWGRMVLLGQFCPVLVIDINLD